MSNEDLVREYGIWKMLGRRWTLEILETLGRDKARRFTELKRMSGISGTVLAYRLLDLEREGVVAKTVHGSMPPRVDYTLTSRGGELLGILIDISRWHARWNTGKYAPATPSLQAL